MKHTIFIIIFLALLTCNITNAQSINTQKIDSFITYVSQHNRDMGSLSIFKGGKEVYNRTFGQVTLFDNHTKFHVGSMTKIFTAVLILKLVEEGELSLNDKLSKLFPKIPNSRIITIKNLLEHSDRRQGKGQQQHPVAAETISQGAYDERADNITNQSYGQGQKETGRVGQMKLFIDGRHGKADVADIVKGEEIAQSDDDQVTFRERPHRNAIQAGQEFHFLAV